MKKLHCIHPEDSVAVALAPLQRGEALLPGLCAREAIPAGHKVCIRPVAAGRPVVKYGFPIGLATEEITPGQRVHTHNLSTALGGTLSYSYTPQFARPLERQERTFSGYLRSDGRAGVRNHIFVLPTVGCVNGLAQRLAERGRALCGGSLEGVYAFPHPYGCSQLGEDHRNTQKILAGLCRHPNAAGVLVLGLGCENNNIPEFQSCLGTWDRERVRFLNCQECADELTEGFEQLRQLAEQAKRDQRQTLPASLLTLGLKCGGSDGFSGITANPLVGALSDRLIACGGTALLTEVPEMFGAERILMERCVSQEVFEKTVQLVNGFKEYFLRHGETVSENPSPGNREGGITTLEEKALGCTQKGGTANVVDVLAYGEQAALPGLNLLWAPGNDLVASTALAASGAQLILFTTGRGTPFGAPVPTVKLSSNTALFKRKPRWIDFDAGTLLDGTPLPELADALFEYVLKLASGECITRAEEQGLFDMAIFKDGVTL